MESVSSFPKYSAVVTSDIWQNMKSMNAFSPNCISILCIQSVCYFSPEILPSQPRDVEAIPVTSSAINLTWTVPKENGHTVHEYVVNVTTLRTFDSPIVGIGYDASTAASASSKGLKKLHTYMELRQFDLTISFPFLPVTGESSSSETLSGSTTMSSAEVVDAKMHQIKVPGEMTHVKIDNLQPFTMYEISVTAFNIHGRSLPSNRVRSLTLAPGIEKPEPKSVPNIPDIKACCISKGVNTES